MVANQTTLRSSQSARVHNGVRIKTIALPVEHGGWGFLLEPIALGLLLAPSIAGFYLALSAIALFLVRQPLTIVVLNRRRKSPRTAWAQRFAALYLVVSVTNFGAAVIFSKHSFILPLMLAAPFAFIQIFYEWSGRKRILFAEVAGTMAISSTAAALALAGGWPRVASFGLCFIIIARAVPSIFYVRGYLARLHHRQTSPVPIFIAHAGALILIALLTRVGLAPWLAIGAMLILAARSLVGFSKARFTAQQLGFSEIGFGALTVLSVVVGNLLER